MLVVNSSIVGLLVTYRLLMTFRLFYVFCSPASLFLVQKFVFSCQGHFLYILGLTVSLMYLWLRIHNYYLSTI